MLLLWKHPRVYTFPPTVRTLYWVVGKSSQERSEALLDTTAIVFPPYLETIPASTRWSLTDVCAGGLD